MLDIGLPYINGCDLARQLKKQYPGLLLIALSGWGQSEDHQKSMEAGFEKHLVKPVTLASIREWITPAATTEEKG
jgi:CheY-like chemotaxis protein